MNGAGCKDGKVRMTVWIDEPLSQHVRVRARESGKPVSEWVERALMKALGATSLGVFCFPPDDGDDEVT
jgi:hypothetical protein